MPRTKTKKKIMMTTMEMRTLVKTEKTMRMKRSHLRMRLILWMRILISSMTRWGREAIRLARSGSLVSSCCLMKRRSRKPWPYPRRWRVPRRKSWMLVLYLIVGAGHCRLLQRTMPLIYRRLDMPILVILIEQIRVLWNKKETARYTTSLHQIVINYKLKM